MIGCLRTRVRKQPIIALYFEFETELKFYNLEAKSVLVLAPTANHANLLPGQTIHSFLKIPIGKAQVLLIEEKNNYCSNLCSLLVDERSLVGVD